MQGSSGQGNQNGQQKQGGLSWTQTPSSGSTNQNSAKPISQVQSPLMPNNNNKGAAANVSNTKNTNSNNNSNLSKKAEPRQGGAGRTASIFIAGVIVGLVIGWGWFSLGGNNGKVATNTTDTNTPVTSSSSETSNATSGSVATTGTSATSGSTSSGTSASTGASAGLLTVASQAAGTQVAVSSVAVSVPTWVVVFDNVNGKPGNALGAQMFFAGERSGTIDLLRATVAGKSYFVGQYIDNGDRKFSKQTDTQVNNIAGAQMLVEFTAR